VTKQRTHAGLRPQKADARPVSRPSDRHEREAERAAEAVARGASVAGWSFSAVPPSPAAPVQRQDAAPKEKTEEEKRTEALKKAGEAALATKEGQALKEKVLKDPLVKTVTDAVTSTPGLIGVGAGIAGGVAALAATGKELPVQPPEIPLEKLSPKLAGVSAQVTYEGPVNAPTYVGLTITVKEQGKKGKGSKKPDPIAADIARLKAQDEMFKRGRTYAPGSKEAEDERLLDEAVSNWVLRGATLPGLTIPLTPPAPEKKQEEQKPAQPAPASPSAAPPAFAEVDDALSSPGRPLDPSTRRAMEARFGYDFSGVRIHDDARAAGTAAELDAAAFTVGEDVVFGAGRFDPASPQGRRLLAHELTHVVQQSRSPGGAGPVIQRRGFFETLGILLGIEEGTWEDSELHTYLDLITQSGQIEGDYDSDNKARAIVRRWKASSPGFDLLPGQKVLLIREMLDGPTLGEDEEAILDLLELSDASDLRAMFGGEDGLSLASLESDVNGDNRTRLDAFVADRFAGGREAVLAGDIEILGDAVPAGAPRFGFDSDLLDARFDSDRTAEELIELVAAMPDADRTQALHHLVAVRRPRQLERAQRLRRMLDDATDEGRREAIRRVGRREREAQLKTERVLLHFYRDAIPSTEADLRHDTAPSDPAREAELREALRPRPRGGGAAPDFQSTLPGESETYEQKVRNELPALVQRYHDDLVAGRGPAEHADRSQTHTLLEFEAIGNVAKDETDAVFGQFYSAADHPALVADVPELEIRGTVHDQFAETEAQLEQMTPDQRIQLAKTLLFYFFQTDDWVRALNRDHDAAPEFDENDAPQNDEAIALDTVATEFVQDAGNVTRLNEIDRNWPATAQGRDIFFQLFRGETPEADRLLLWDVFQTFIHEYLHTLAHDDYDAYAETFGSNSNEFNTLIEGVDSLLTEIVWDAIEPRVGDQALREQIEGPTNAAEPAIRVPHPAQRRYPSYTEALRLVDLVGIQALYAAYFLGLVDRIGGTTPTPAGGTP
jgi:Domain of unknown function (DUF4157)